MIYWKILLLGTFTIVNINFAALQNIDKIAAIVNNDVVLESDVNNLIKLVKLNVDQIDQQLPNDTLLRRQILERLIFDQIILQIGKKMGIKITDRKIDQTIADIAERNNMTIDQIKTRLAYDGIDYSIYRNQIYNDMIVSEVRNNEVRRRITILPQEIDILAKQLSNQDIGDSIEMKLGHILIPFPKNPTKDQISLTREKANSIIDQAYKNSDFDELSTKYSSTVDLQTLKNKYIGWKHIQKLPFVFAQALSAAKKGDIVGPIRSRIGFHIFKVNDLRNQNQNTFVTEVHVRHILLKESPIMTGDQASMKLKQIAADIKNGKILFSDAAKKFSQDLNSINQGGDLGWATIDIYDPAFRNALMKLNKGQISDPIYSSFGWHLIELLDIRNVDRTDVIQKNRAYRVLFNRKFSEETTIWIQEQRAGAYVKILSNTYNANTSKTSSYNSW